MGNSVEMQMQNAAHARVLFAGCAYKWCGVRFVRDPRAHLQSRQLCWMQWRGCDLENVYILMKTLYEYICYVFNIYIIFVVYFLCCNDDDVHFVKYVS